MGKNGGIRKSAEELLGRDTAMYEMYRAGARMREIGQRFGLTNGGVSGVFKRRGWPVNIRPLYRDKPSRLDSIDDTALMAQKAIWDQLDSKAKGSVVEGYVASRLTELGFDVWRPFTLNHTSDMGVFVDGRFLRIQVKTATYDPPSKRFRATLKTRDRTRAHQVYASGLLDFFIVFCPIVTAYYVVPAGVGNRNPSLNLLPHRGAFKRGPAYEWEAYRDAFDLLRTTDSR